MTRGIWAGIVSYNPDLERLRENVDAIVPQVDRLLIFDNGSNNAISVDENFGGRAQVIKSAKNLGMAKALNCLAKTAYEGGASDIVLLDQDSIASANLVETESRFRAEDIGLVSCLIVDRNVERVDADPCFVMEAKRAITSGSMVNLEAWNSVGNYDETLFVDWVDNEFCDNLRFHGYRIFVTYATSILHEMGDQERVFNAPGRDYTHAARSSRGYYRQNYPSWRWRDRARGQVLAMRKYKGTRIMFDELDMFLRGTVGRILFLEKNKAECLRAVWDGAKAAYSLKMVDDGRC